MNTPQKEVLDKRPLREMKQNDESAETDSRHQVGRYLPARRQKEAELWPAKASLQLRRNVLSSSPEALILSLFLV